MVARRPRYPPAASAEIPGNSLERGFPNDQDTIAKGIASPERVSLIESPGFPGALLGPLAAPGFSLWGFWAPLARNGRAPGQTCPVGRAYGGSLSCSGSLWGGSWRPPGALLGAS